MKNTIDEIPDELKPHVDPGEEVRCTNWDDSLGRVCNKKLFNGKPSTEPQEFKCRGCGKKITIQRLG